MLIDISVNDYIEVLELQKEKILKEVDRLVERKPGTYYTSRMITYDILEKFSWLQEKKSELSEIEQKIELLKEM